MLRFTQVRVAAAAAAILLSGGAIAVADPGEEHGHDGIPVPAPTLPLTPPGASNFTFLDAADKDGTINSDIAFYGNRAYVGNYDGFRIIDIFEPDRLRVLSDIKCRANQGDVSVFKPRDGRRILLQSIDRPVTAPDCSGVDTGTIDRARGPGRRVHDRSDERRDAHARRASATRGCGCSTSPTRATRATCASTARRAARTRTRSCRTRATGWCTRTSRRIRSAGRSRRRSTVRASDALGLTCEAPHQKISIVHIPLSDPEAGTVEKKALSSDSEPYDPDGEPRVDDGVQHGNAPAFISCHDHQAFLARDVMVGSCAGDAQYWSIKRPRQPDVGRRRAAHAHQARGRHDASRSTSSTTPS